MKDPPDPRLPSRTHYYLTLYAFLLALAYVPIVNRFLGGPGTIVATFSFLFLFGFALGRPSQLGRIPPLDARAATVLAVAAIFLNFSSLLFGRHFALFSYSPLLATLFLSPMVVRARSKILVIATLAAAILIIDVSLVRTVPLDRSGAMLTLIDAAGDVLMAGRNPYLERLDVPVGDRGFIYIPGLLLAYMPAKATGADIRYVNVAAAILFWLGLTLAGKRQSSEPGWREETLFSFAILTSPFVSHLIATKHTFFYGVILFSLTVFTGRANAVASNVLLGAAIVVRQFSAVLAPIVWWSTRKTLLRDLALVSFIIAAVFGPFLASDPDRFLPVASGRVVMGRYDDQPVDFSKNYSPGGANAFNLGHLIKLFVPAWSSALTMSVAALLEAVVLLALIKEFLRPTLAMYFAYACYLAFTINFSDYMLWDNLSIGWAIAWCSGETNST